MTSIQTQLNTHFTEAFLTAFGDAAPVPEEPLIVPASNPKFGDYQCNVALPLAKPLQLQPRAIAATLLKHVQLDEWCEPPEIAGPGFINLSLKPTYLAAQLLKIQPDERLGVDRVQAAQRVIVDFSSPNIAKEMHVGHLRSTIIGDSIARILEFRGHHVLRLNHVGDWGTQFGMLIAYLREAYPEALTTADALDLGDLVTLYKQAKQRFDADEPFRDSAREEVVRLQAGAADSQRAWELLCAQSRREFQAIYDRLDIKLTERGESFYNPLLLDIVERLAAAGLLQADGGAQCVFLEGFTNKEGEPLPLIVQKSDGGYNYATTDLAALHYRISQDESDRIIYVTDAGQANHFAQVFQVARRAGILPERVEVVHVPFGLVQGEDGKKLKTRSGETIRLKDLLDEAVDRAYQDLNLRLQLDGRTETEEFKRHVATTVGISAVKYADLSQNRTSNYVFSYDKMLALQGNTSPYLLYAYARIRSIARKGASDSGQLAAPLPTDDTAQTAAIPLLTLCFFAQQVGQFLATDGVVACRTVPWLRPVATQLEDWRDAPIRWDAIAWTCGAIVLSFLFGDVLIKVHQTLHTVPFLPALMCLVGAVATGKWTWKFLIFAQGRQQFITQLHQTQTRIFGGESAPRMLMPMREIPSPIQLTEPEELSLAKHILQLSDILQEVERELLPNRLCQYLFELSQKFNQFFEQCPVLKSAEPRRTSRLALCDLTARTLELGLSLLGIPVLERM